MTAPRQQTIPSYRLPLIALLGAFAVASLLVARYLAVQPAGMDFLCFWTGGQVAITDPGRIYDFQHVTALQGFDFAAGVLRPYINPPSALLLFAPFAFLPAWVAYSAFALLGGGLLLWGGLRAGAPWWLILLPSVAFTIFCGQATLLLGGLVLLGLTFRDWPLVAGLLFALAACIKPQLLILLPLALAAQGRWRTILFTGMAGLAICGLSAVVFGFQPWLDWLSALPRFHRLILDNPSLLKVAITPYAKLAALGWNGAWAYLLAPVVAWGVWTAFRREAGWPDQLIALLGGALLISPYGMAYELALFAPAVAAYLARTDDRRWPLYALVAAVYATDATFGIFSLAAVLAMPVLGAGSARAARPIPA